MLSIESITETEPCDTLKKINMTSNADRIRGILFGDMKQLLLLLQLFLYIYKVIDKSSITCL